MNIAANLNCVLCAVVSLENSLPVQAVTGGKGRGQKIQINYISFCKLSFKSVGEQGTEV